MVTRESAWPQGMPCWVDVAAEDVDAARLFYEQLFGWQIPPGSEEFGGYSTCRLGENPVAGLSPTMSPEQRSAWMLYFATESADASIAAVIANGGTVIAAPMQVGALGTMALALDPSGCAFGLWQAGEHLGYLVSNEPGSLIWEENMSADMAGNQAFYHAVFGFTYADMSADGFSYASFGVPATGDPDRPAGGIGQIPAGDDSPPGWGLYFAVEDADESVDQVVKLGGSVIRPGWDTPFGRMAMVADPGGARFAVMSAPQPG